MEAVGEAHTWSDDRRTQVGGNGRLHTMSVAEIEGELLALARAVTECYVELAQLEGSCAPVLLPVHRVRPLGGYSEQRGVPSVARRKESEGPVPSGSCRRPRRWQ